jgi:hypothetical protein
MLAENVMVHALNTSVEYECLVQVGEVRDEEVRR